MAADRGSVDRALTGQSLESYLRDDERLVHALTNQEVGVKRTDGDGERVITPAADRGAVAALTDRRLLFAVGKRDGNFVGEVAHTDVADAELTVETLTARLVVETATGTTWSFTAREADIDAVGSFLTMACDGWAAVDALETHCERLAEFVETGEWDAFDEHTEQAKAALERGRASDAAGRIEAIGSRLDRLAEELFELLRDRHVLAGQAALGSAEDQLESGEYAASYDRLEDARAAFGRAVAIAADHDIDTGPAADGLARTEQYAGAVVAKPWAVARQRARVARDCTGLSERIERLEDAFEAYQTLAQLVTGDPQVFSGDPATVREESEALIESLVEARLTRADERRTAGEWEWEAGNDGAAYEQFATAQEDLDRAAALASSYPPGDAEAIQQRLDSLLSHIDPLVIRQELSEASTEE